MKTQIIGTGLSGLVGTRIVELLKSDFEFIDLSYDTAVDITNKEQVHTKIKNLPANIVLHMAAKADVEGCEKDKSIGKDGEAWKINVEGTRNIADVCRIFGKKVIYISTDFVFAGKKESYDETDLPYPINWYGITKFEGEKIILSQNQNLVVRISYPYRATNPTKPDFVHSWARVLNSGKELQMINDHIFTPTLIDDIAYALKILIEKNAEGIYHVVGETSLTPFEAALEIAALFGFKKELIKETRLDKFQVNKTERPSILRIKNDKLTGLGYNMRTFPEGLSEIKKQGFIL